MQLSNSNRKRRETHVTPGVIHGADIGRRRDRDLRPGDNRGRAPGVRRATRSVLPAIYLILPALCPPSICDEESSHEGSHGTHSGHWPYAQNGDGMLIHTEPQRVGDSVNRRVQSTVRRFRFPLPLERWEVMANRIDIGYTLSQYTDAHKRKNAGLGPNTPRHCRHDPDPQC